MITRIWHGKTSLENSEKYLENLLEQGTLEYRDMPGNISVKVWQYNDDDISHFWTVTEWKDREAVKAFAGEDFEKAKYYPADNGMLLEFEEKVQHYNSYDVSNIKVSEYIRQLKELYFGGSWQGEFFTDKLDDINEEAAFTQPAIGIHSIAEILWHCIYWRKVTIKALEGDPGYSERTFSELNFLDPDTLKEKGWESLKQEFHSTEQKLIELLYGQKDTILEMPYKNGKNIGYLLEGIIQHDIYHLGQLGLIIAILKRKRIIQEENT